MTFEGYKLFHSTNVEDSQSLIPGGAGKHVTIDAPGNGLDGVLMAIAELKCDGQFPDEAR